MGRRYCKKCGRIIGYTKPTGKYTFGIPEVKTIYTHAEYKEVVVFPNAKVDKYKYGKRLFCDYCGQMAN